MSDLCRLSEEAARFVSLQVTRTGMFVPVIYWNKPSLLKKTTFWPKSISYDWLWIGYKRLSLWQKKWNLLCEFLLYCDSYIMCTMILMSSFLMYMYWNDSVTIYKCMLWYIYTRSKTCYLRIEIFKMLLYSSIKLVFCLKYW